MFLTNHGNFILNQSERVFSISYFLIIITIHEDAMYMYNGRKNNDAAFICDKKVPQSIHPSNLDVLNSV